MSHGNIETVKDDIGTKPQDIAKRWLMERDLASDGEDTWRDRGRKVVDRFRDEKSRERFNILWANTMTLLPAIYNSTPKPDVRRRWRQRDNDARLVALGLERALAYSIDEYDFDCEIFRTLMDYLLPGRGVPRVRYIPIINEVPEVRVSVEETADGLVAADGLDIGGAEIQTDDQGAFISRGGDMELEHEQVVCEHVHWEDYRMSPCRSRREMRWEAFRHVFTRDELREEFDTKKANDVKLDVMVDGAPANAEDFGDFYKRGEVWEIWDRETEKVYYISKGLDVPLMIIDDPYELPGFFSTPIPIVSIETTDSTVPIPEFTLYQDLANELEVTSRRINNLVDALRVRGLYDATIDEIKNLLKQGDNKLIPVENWSRLKERGGLDNVVDWMPIEQIAKVLAGLYNQRDQLLNTIYQVTGIADIMRGATDPRETLGAQQLKGQFGTLRLRPRQNKVQTMIKQIFEIKAHIIAKKFSVRTLSNMVGVELSQQQIQLLRDSDLRRFRIDIETDSTIADVVAQDKQELIEFMTGLTGMFQQVMPLVQAQIVPQEVAHQFILFFSRRFKVSRELEEALETLGGTGDDGLQDPSQQQPHEPTAEEQAASADQQRQDQQQQVDTMARAKELQLEEQKLRLLARELGLKEEEIQNKRLVELLQLIIQRQQNAQQSAS